MSAKSATKALTSPFKKIGRQIERSTMDVLDMNMKPFEELARVPGNVKDFVSPDMPDVTIESDDPAPLPEAGGDPLDALRRRKKRSGRASTIQAGNLVPEATGKKTLLG